MLGFVQSWFGPTANPIGVDFGSDSLRMAQVERTNPEAPGPGDFKLVAAARADVPTTLKHDPAGKLAFFAEMVREMWAGGNFRGKRAVLSLPASVLTIQHLRVPKMDDEALKKALPWESRGKLPYDPSHALLRHLVAGEIHQDGEQKNEVILMAAQREWVNQFLASAARAKLDVVGMNVEPLAVVDCFGHTYRRKVDAESTTLFVDIGCIATRAFISRSTQISFARIIPVGGDHFTRAVADRLSISFEDAKIRRAKICETAATEPAATSETPAPAPAGDAETFRINDACAEPVARLVEELSLCRRYHESTFPSLPVNRVVFIGGEARQRGLCQAVAQGLELAAQVGDPMVRMARVSEVGPESGIDRRLPQPDWAVAIGLSMGPVNAPVAVEAK